MSKILSSTVILFFPQQVIMAVHYGYFTLKHLKIISLFNFLTSVIFVVTFNHGSDGSIEDDQVLDIK